MACLALMLACVLQNDAVRVVKDLPPLGAMVLRGSPIARKLYFVRGFSSNVEAMDVNGKITRAATLKGEIELSGTDAAGNPIVKTRPANAPWNGDLPQAVDAEGKTSRKFDIGLPVGDVRDGIILQAAWGEAVLSWPIPEPPVWFADAARRLAIVHGGCIDQRNWGVSPDHSLFAALLYGVKPNLVCVDMKAKRPLAKWVALTKRDGTALGDASVSNLCVLDRKVAVALVPNFEFDHAPYHHPRGYLGPDVYDEALLWDYVLVKIDLAKGTVAPLRRFKLSVFTTRMETLAPGGLLVVSDNQALRIFRIDGIP